MRRLRRTLIHPAALLLLMRLGLLVALSSAAALVPRVPSCSSAWATMVQRPPRAPAALLCTAASGDEVTPAVITSSNMRTVDMLSAKEMDPLMRAVARDKAGWQRVDGPFSVSRLPHASRYLGWWSEAMLGRVMQLTWARMSSTQRSMRDREQDRQRAADMLRERALRERGAEPPWPPTCPSQTCRWRRACAAARPPTSAAGAAARRASSAGTAR